MKVVALDLGPQPTVLAARLLSVGARGVHDT
jgi:hypothetical protein